jgi:hypothetical protein
MRTKNIISLPYFIFGIIISFCCVESNAQLLLRPSESIKFWNKNGEILSLAQAGGLNNPQFNSIDLDLDGIEDLLIYEAPSKSVITLKNAGIANTIQYSYKPELSQSLPFINNWVVCVDFDLDGKKDLFTSFNSGVRVYRNVSTATELKFEVYIDDLQALFNTFYTNVFVSAQDIPAILDIDADGDIDILTFELGIGNGDALYLYKNLAKEKHNRTDTLDMALDFTCWGGFREDANNCKITLDACSGNKQYNDLKEKINHSLHAGSSTLIFDVNNDNLPDVLLGDLGCNTMALLINGGTLESPRIVQEINNFPSTKPINISIFPAAFHIDVNNDGLKDLIIAPHASSASENKNNVLLYLKTGNGINDWSYQGNTFLVDQMLDFGEGCYPRFVDFDNDGLIDIVAGNVGYFTPSLNLSSSLAFLKNTQNQGFQLMDSNAINLSSLNFTGLTPAFADINKDQKIDIIFGEREGNVHYVINNAASGKLSEISALNTQINVQQIDAGQFSQPIVLDIDKDGIQDLTIGSKISRVSYYKGTISGSFEYVTDSLVKFSIESSTTKNVAHLNHQFYDVNKDGKLDMMVTSLDGKIYLFDNIEDKLNGTFSSSQHFNPKMGQRIGFDIGDWNKDGIIDMVVGSYRGGLAIFSVDFTSSIANLKTESAFTLLRNAQGNWFVESQHFTKPYAYKILGNQGEILQSGIIESENHALELSELNSGIYIFQTELGAEKLWIIE